MASETVDILLRLRNQRQFQQGAQQSGKAIGGVGKQADRASKAAREADLRERAPAAADRDHGVPGGGDGQVPRVPDSRDDDMVDPGTRGVVRLPREDSYRRASRRLRAARRGRHHPAAAAADDGAAAGAEQAADRLGDCLVLRAAADHRDLDGAHAAKIAP